MMIMIGSHWMDKILKMTKGLLFAQVILAYFFQNGAFAAAVEAGAVSPTPYRLGCGKADLVFLLDQSNSISEADMTRGKQFISDVIGNLEISRNDTLVGLLSFAARADERFRLDRFLNKEELQREVHNLERLNSPATATDEALRMLRERIRSSQFGSRPGVAKIAIVITDGASSKPAQTYEEAQLVHKDNIIVFAIGVGKESNKLNETELRLIASDPDRYYSFLVDDWGALQNIERILAERSCQGDTTLALGVSNVPRLKLRSRKPIRTNNDAMKNFDKQMKKLHLDAEPDMTDFENVSPSTIPVVKQKGKRNKQKTARKKGKKMSRIQKHKLRHRNRYRKSKQRAVLPKVAGAPKPPMRVSDTESYSKKMPNGARVQKTPSELATAPECVCTCPPPDPRKSQGSPNEAFLTKSLPNMILKNPLTTAPSAVDGRDKGNYPKTYKKPGTDKENPRGKEREEEFYTPRPQEGDSRERLHPGPWKNGNYKGKDGRPMWPPFVIEGRDFGDRWNLGPGKKADGKVCTPTSILFVPSGTAGPLEMNSISLFVQKITETIQSNEKKYRLGIQPVACASWSGLSLGDLTNKRKVFENLKKWRLSVADTVQLIDEMRSTFKHDKDSPPGSRKVAVLFVDHTSDKALDAVYTARKAQEEGIEMYVIGVGQDYNEEKAMLLSSLPSRTYFITARSYAQLSLVAPALIQELSICTKET